ncbi:ROK family protein [Paenibacillus radicis (ex Gao et al. 2016)]|uniref:Transcriptional regulator n=1 Tax=Paenibacillus radicis (ex Gao et al. 2016) TaxID=1737354 RepID=A0A917HAR5_9BACL|nr:ROK family protein [Paenibacillus radicis (ex Gao et al. 2016)]GGG73260.1 transcriptional regulator [Paenibacillus radicis (ex Gao et al. 2016)]
MTNKMTTKKQVYDYIARNGIVSKAELMTQFKLKINSMTRLLEELIAENWLQEKGLGYSTGGRPPILYETNAHRGYLLGLEISRIYSSMGLYDLHMNRLSLVRWTMDETMTPERFIDRVQETVQSFLKQHELSSEQIIGIGVGAVGPLDRERGLIVDPVLFPASGWRDLPICSLLEERLGFPALLDNGANTALIGEHWALRSERYEHMLYVHAGAGLRSAMMSGGELVYGATDTEGAVGQMIIQAGGPRLHDTGNYGALEAFVSLQALESKVRALSSVAGTANLSLQQGDTTALAAQEPITFETMIRALAKGDADVLDIFNEAAAYLGIGLANLINVLHPEKVIIGGALLNAHETMFDTAIRVAEQNTYYYPKYKPLFSKGILKEDAVAAGAAVMVLKKLQL